MTALVRFALFAATLGLATAGGAAPARKAPVDVATVAAGVYHGAVISDARGSSRSNVTVTVTRTAPNTVSIAADYARIPARTFRLTRVMDSIQNAGGSEVFLLETARTPQRLSLTIDDAAWSGEKH